MACDTRPLWSNMAGNVCIERQLRTTGIANSWQATGVSPSVASAVCHRRNACPDLRLHRVLKSRPTSMCTESLGFRRVMGKCCTEMWCACADDVKLRPYHHGEYRRHWAVDIEYHLVLLYAPVTGSVSRSAYDTYRHSICFGLLLLTNADSCYTGVCQSQSVSE